MFHLRTAEWASAQNACPRCLSNSSDESKTSACSAMSSLKVPTEAFCGQASSRQICAQHYLLDVKTVGQQACECIIIKKAGASGLLLRSSENDPTACPPETIQ